MAAVLKTVVPKGTGGSNPSASANEITDEWTLKVYSLKIHSFEFYFVNRIPYTKTGDQVQNPVLRNVIENK